MNDLTPLSSHELTHRVRSLESRADEHSDILQGVLTTQATMVETLKGIKEAVESTKGNIEWASKLVMGAVLLAILALVLKESSHSDGAGGSSHSPSAQP